MDAAQFGLGREYLAIDGPYLAGMRALGRNGYALLTAAQVVTHRLQSTGTKFQDAWLHTNICTSAGLAATSRAVYVTANSQLLRETARPDATLHRGGVALDISREPGIQTFARTSALEKLLNRTMRYGEFLAHPLWQEALGVDDSTLDLYGEIFYGQGSERFGFERMMGFYVPMREEPPLIRPLVLTGLHRRHPMNAEPLPPGRQRTVLIGREDAPTPRRTRAKDARRLREKKR